MLDFHALRHTTGSWLPTQNVHSKIVQRIMRHSTITLTMDRYTHLFRGDESAAVAKLPDLGPTRPNAEPIRATGTCDGARRPLHLPESGAEQCHSLPSDATITGQTTATGRTRTVNLRFTKPLAESVTSETTSTYDKSDLRLPASLPEILKNDPDLGAVVAAWPDLPKAIRAGIVAMVRAAKNDEGVSHERHTPRSICDLDLT